MAGHRVPGRGAEDRPRRQARAADRLRRHRGGDRGDQRGRARLLPAEAVGSARGAAVPGRRGPADDLGGGRGARVRRACGSSATASRKETRTTCATSSPATASPRAGSTSSATARPASCCRSPASTPSGCPSRCLEDGSVLERPTILELAERLGVAGAPAQEHYDLVIVGGGPAGSPPRSTAPRRGCGRCSSSARRPAARPASRAGSRTTSAFPTGLSGSDLARRATDQARRLGAELLTVQDARRRCASRARARIVELSGGGELSANCVLVASGVSYRQLDDARLRRATRAPASTTARR